MVSKLNSEAWVGKGLGLRASSDGPQAFGQIEFRGVGGPALDCKAPGGTGLGRTLQGPAVDPTPSQRINRLPGRRRWR